jgi:hypothetical protein
MRCAICCRPDVREINLEILQRRGMGVVTALAKRLGICRQTVWRHKRFHLKIYQPRKAVKVEQMSFVARARALAVEADRLQLALENGMPTTAGSRALQALHLRVKLLHLESQYANSPTKQEPPPAVLEDPEADERARREFEEIVGHESDR